MSGERLRLPKSIRALRRPARLRAWGSGEGPDRVAAVEGDVRRLLAEAAEARAALAERDTKDRREAERHLEALLEVADALDRIVANAERTGRGDRGWAGNVRTVRRMLGNVLAERGVTPVETAGRPFDPAWHTAVETAPAEPSEDGVILSEVRGGFRWGDRVLRRAEVVVGSAALGEARPAGQADDPVP